MTAKQTDATNEKLYQEFNTVVAETEQLLKSVASAGSDRANALQDGVVQGLAAAGQRLDKLRQDALAQASAAATATDDYVRDSPWRAVGIAAAAGGLIGLAAGLLIARR